MQTNKQKKNNNKKKKQQDIINCAPCPVLWYMPSSFDVELVQRGHLNLQPVRL